MPADYKGFDRWGISDPNFPYPIGEFDLFFSDTAGAAVTCDIFLPDAIPDKRTVAERSIGITDSYKFWIALACSKDAAGAVTVEVVLTGRHVHWFESHGEDGPGPDVEIRLSQAEAAGGGSRQVLGAHHDHCNSLTVSWGQADKGRVHCFLSGFHWRNSPEDFRKAVERAKREADIWPRLKPLLPSYDFAHPKPSDPPPDPKPSN